MIISFAISIILSYIGLPMIKDLLLNANVVCENYESKLYQYPWVFYLYLFKVATLGTMEILFDFNSNFNLSVSFRNKLLLD